MINVNYFDRGYQDGLNDVINDKKREYVCEKGFKRRFIKHAIK